MQTPTETKLRNTMRGITKELQDLRQKNALKDAIIRNYLSDKILDDFRRSNGIRITANRYGFDIKYMMECIAEWDKGYSGLNVADDYLACLFEIHGRRRETTYFSETDWREKMRTPNSIELTSILRQYAAGGMTLYALADAHNLWINNLFRLLHDMGCFIEERNVVGYEAFLKTYYGSDFQPNATPEALNLIVEYDAMIHRAFV